MIDESFIDMDKKYEKERVKKLATSTTQFYHPKGVDATEIDYFGKLIMCSNNENNFISLEKSDVRFFILKVRTLENEDPDFLDKLIDEIPCFLYFLKHRTIFHPKKSRAWFDHQHLITPQFHQIVKHTRPRLEQDIQDYIQEQMLNFNVEMVRIDPFRLTKAINELSRYKHSVSDVRRFLKEERGMKPLKMQRFSIPMLVSNPLNPDEVTVYNENFLGRPYEFLKEDWVEEE
jgi:hypothetical protein